MYFPPITTFLVQRIERDDGSVLYTHMIYQCQLSIHMDRIDTEAKAAVHTH